MQRLTSLAMCSVLIPMKGVLEPCGNQAKMTTCRFGEIEGAEFATNLGDLGAERGEGEMACGTGR